jgi:hypothetical protein
MVSKSHSKLKVTLRRDNVSKLTSAGFLSLRRCAGMAEGLLVQAEGGWRRDGCGGVREGKVTGIGRAGGGLSFLQSCWPARMPPACESCQYCSHKRWKLMRRSASSFERSKFHRAYCVTKRHEGRNLPPKLNIAHDSGRLSEKTRTTALTCEAQSPGRLQAVVT